MDNVNRVACYDTDNDTYQYISILFYGVDWDEEDDNIVPLSFSDEYGIDYVDNNTWIAAYKDSKQLEGIIQSVIKEYENPMLLIRIVHDTNTDKLGYEIILDFQLHTSKYDM